MNETAFVYHIEDPSFPGNTHYGYIGVTKKTIQERFREHCDSPYVVGQKIRRLELESNSISIIFSGSIDECYALEHKLRPNTYIGWNLAPGGGGPPPFSPYTKEKRSIVQKERMANVELRIIQGETFKERYYSNQSLIELRSQRTKEHMADPEKRKKCLTAIHKKYKCPHCDHENNKPNLARHIRKHHPNVN